MNYHIKQAKNNHVKHNKEKIMNYHIKQKNDNSEDYGQNNHIKQTQTYKKTK